MDYQNKELFITSSPQKTWEVCSFNGRESGTRTNLFFPLHILNKMENKIFQNI